MNAAKTLATLGLAALSACGKTAPPVPSGGQSTAALASSTGPKPAKLWILNQGGDPNLADFFSCMLDGSNWNALATAYPGARPVVLGRHVVAQPNGRRQYPCTAKVGSQAYYQCVVNAGKFDLAAGDVVLAVQPDGSVGGLDNQFSSDPTNISDGPNQGRMTVSNPLTHETVPIQGAHVGNATSSDPQNLFVYAAHEVFEAQTDGISADCCDGETTSGGPIPGCPDCGPFQTPDGRFGLCGQYAAPGGSFGIASITCPSGNTYRYQQVSPPGAHAYGSPEFNGTCQDIRVTQPVANPCAGVFGANNGLYCGAETTGGGFDPSEARPADLYDCQNGVVASVTACPAACFNAPPGQPDGCNPDPCAHVPSSGNGTYCGTSTQDGFGGGGAGTLYTCQNGVTAAAVACLEGCHVAPLGQPDGCN